MLAWTPGSDAQLKKSGSLTKTHESQGVRLLERRTWVTPQPHNVFPVLQIPTLFLVGMICRPSTKKGIGIYHGNPGFSKKNLETGGIWSKGLVAPSHPVP